MKFSWPQEKVDESLIPILHRFDSNSNTGSSTTQQTLDSFVFRAPEHEQPTTSSRLQRALARLRDTMQQQRQQQQQKKEEEEEAAKKQQHPPKEEGIATEKQVVTPLLAKAMEMKKKQKRAGSRGRGRGKTK